MHERIIELLLLLMGELHTEKQLGEIDVSTLTKQGYTQSEISTAFAWLFERMKSTGSTERFSQPRRSSHRMLHAAEKTSLNKEGYGYLLQCLHLGLLSMDDMETVIERVMMAGFADAGEAEVKAIIGGVLFGSDRKPDGSTPLIGPHDSIH